LRISRPTPLREVLEETGLSATLITKLGDVKYIYVRKWAGNEKVFMVVSFFLTEYKSGKIGEITEAMRHEGRRAYWLPLAEAPKKLSYNGEGLMVEKALDYVKAHPIWDSDFSQVNSIRVCSWHK